jgi:hypothetical protein
VEFVMTVARIECGGERKELAPRVLKEAIGLGVAGNALVEIKPG